MKKINIFLVALFIVLFSFSSAYALTDQERQNLINQLMQQILQLQNQVQTQTGNIWCYDFSQNLSIGSSGFEVTNLQKALNNQGFLASNYINGNFDVNTYDAVIKFQEKYKSEILSPFKLKLGTGKVGPSTRAKLNKIFSCKLLSKCVPSWTCSDWGKCSNEVQKRKCTDSKKCNTVFGKPQETQQCMVPSVILKGNNVENKVTINTGESVEISWIAQNVNSCTASGNWSGSKSLFGLENSGSLVNSRVYNISCVDSLGKVVSDSLTVNVLSLFADIKANKSDKLIEVNAGESVKLNWESSGATSCTASGDWLGIKAQDGTESTGFLYQPKKYIYYINCSGLSGNIQDFVEVNVKNPYVMIKANNSDGPLEIESGKIVKLTWESSGVNSCKAIGNWSGAKTTSGSESMGNITTNKFYVLECKDYFGNKLSDTVSVKIK